jgi:Zn-dependent protease
MASILPSKQGAFPLFQFAGIQVYLHWSWFIAAVYSIQYRTDDYSSMWWNAWEYLALFAIVTMHEFGHSLACRQVGGKAEQIILWPFGGVAFVAPPPRPGAVLWSIAAGPLVNVVLLPVTYLAYQFTLSSGLGGTMPGLVHLTASIAFINLGLLLFNMLPVYPLDGGQILRALLWFKFGPNRSLLFAAGFGFVGVAGLVALAVWAGSVWIGIMAAFVFMHCKSSWDRARTLTKVAAMPRHHGFACPNCGGVPPRGEIWLCGRCRKPFDPFLTHAFCPSCGAEHPVTACIQCGQAAPIGTWEKHPTSGVQP